jgi:hypothetical protein
MTSYTTLRFPVLIKRTATCAVGAGAFLSEPIAPVVWAPFTMDRPLIVRAILPLLGVTAIVRLVRGKQLLGAGDGRRINRQARALYWRDGRCQPGAPDTAWRLNAKIPSCEHFVSLPRFSKEKRLKAHCDFNPNVWLLSVGSRFRRGFRFGDPLLKPPKSESTQRKD